MTPRSECAQKAQDCQLLAAASDDPVLKAGWEALARHWRDLAGDEDAQATTARLVEAARGQNELQALTRLTPARMDGAEA